MRWQAPLVVALLALRFSASASPASDFELEVCWLHYLFALLQEKSREFTLFNLFAAKILLRQPNCYFAFIMGQILITRDIQGAAFPVDKYVDHHHALSVRKRMTFHLALATQK